MALSWTDLGLILAASLWMAVPFLLALCLCVLVEMLFPSEELSLRERLPGALFVLALPVSAAFIVPPFHAFWRFIECPILIDLRWMPDWLLLATLILLWDFCNYWEHRFEHRFLWSFHAVHHAPTQLHAAHTYAHPVQLICQFFFKVLPFSLLGLKGVAVPALAVVMVAFWNFFIHASTRLHVGPLRWLLVDNRFHRIHHSVETRHFDKNFAPVFSIWDQLFGTAHFPAPDEHPAVGVEDVRPPRSYFDLLVMPVRRAERKIAAGSVVESFADVSETRPVARSAV